jgi:broad specificity phosphatase PhoE
MTAQTCTLYLVRHGQTQWNVDRIIQGHSNIPLNEEGKRQTHEQRENLKHIAFSKVYSSDLIRAHKTAEILNSDRKLDHQTSNTLRERNFGLYEGTSMEQHRFRLWDLLAHHRDHPHIKESHVESDEQMVMRALPFLREVSTKNKGQNVLIVTHGGLMRTLLIHLGYAEVDDFPPNAIKNLAYIKIECDGKNFVINETSGITLNKS